MWVYGAARDLDRLVERVVAGDSRVRVGDSPAPRERGQERLLHGVRHGRARPREEGHVDDAVGAADPRAATRSPSTSATRACTACASGSVLQLTEDHTLINYKVKHGMMTKAEAEKASRQERHHARGRPQGLRPGRHRRHRRRRRAIASCCAATACTATSRATRRSPSCAATAISRSAPRPRSRWPTSAAARTTSRPWSSRSWRSREYRAVGKPSAR